MCPKTTPISTPNLSHHVRAASRLSRAARRGSRAAAPLAALLGAPAAYKGPSRKPPRPSSARRESRRVYHRDERNKVSLACYDFRQRARATAIRLLSCLSSRFTVVVVVVVKSILFFSCRRRSRLKAAREQRKLPAGRVFTFAFTFASVVGALVSVRAIILHGANNSIVQVPLEACFSPRPANEWPNKRTDRRWPAGQ